MYPVALTLLLLDRRVPAPAEAAAVQDALWAHARPGDGLEHVRALACQGGIGVVLYLRAPHRGAAERLARGLLAHALNSPAHEGYSIALRAT